MGEAANRISGRAQVGEQGRSPCVEALETKHSGLFRSTGQWLCCGPGVRARVAFQQTFLRDEFWEVATFNGIGKSIKCITADLCNPTHSKNTPSLSIRCLGSWQQGVGAMALLRGIEAALFGRLHIPA